MLSFASSLSHNSDAFAIFVSEDFDYKDKKNILSNEVAKKINSFLKSIKAKKKKEEIYSLDISEKEKCFIIVVKKKI